MSRTVLIDADILAFQIASSQEQVYDFNGEHVLHADLNKGAIEVENAIGWIMDHTGADDASLFLTGTNNFRKGILPTYKANRTGSRRPMILSGLRKWMLENTRCFLEDILEGDDLIGIHATMPHEGERVIYSADKDLKTVPGLHWDEDDGEVVEVSQEDADMFFYEQILTGDPTDNYKGCPGVGPVAARDLLQGGHKWLKETAEYKSGPRKGELKITWAKVPSENPWESILSAYHKVGLRERDALQQARCARILRHGEYDFNKQEVNLWTFK